MTSLPYLSATELVDQFRRRTLSPTEVCEAVLDHIARWEPKLCALYAFDPDAARAAAKLPPRAGRRASRPGRSTACR